MTVVPGSRVWSTVLAVDKVTRIALVEVRSWCGDDRHWVAFDELEVEP